MGTISSVQCSSDKSRNAFDGKPQYTLGFFHRRNLGATRVLRVQNQSDPRFAERFAESVSNSQFYELIFDRRKYRVSGLEWHHQGKFYGRRSGLVFE